MIRELLTDQELITAVRCYNEGRAYNVIVTGRMNEQATYRINARNAEVARRIGREYAKRIDRAAFTLTHNPQVSLVTRCDW